MEKSSFIISGQSLYPVFKCGDSVELMPITTVERFDYVVFDFLEKLICKQVVGMPGDQFEVNDGFLVVNDTERYPMYGRQTLQHFSESFNKVLIKDEYIVLGNNNSMDSANFGPVNRRLIVGKLNATQSCGTLSGDSPGIFWDATSVRLGVGAATPGSQLTMTGGD